MEREKSQDEIEITPEMKEAGAYAWAKGDREFDSPEEIATQIFVAMLQAKKPECKA